MLKHKKFLSLLLLLPIFSVFSCAKPKEPYPIVKKDGNLVVAITKTKYKNNEELKIDNVTYSGTTLTWAEKNYKKENTYFICTSADYPTNTIVGDLKMVTNVEVNELKFYVAHFDSQNQKIHLSEEKKVTITNDGAIKPWVWYVVTGVVVFAVVGMIVFTRRYKAKKEGKL